MQNARMTMTGGRRRATTSSRSVPVLSVVLYVVGVLAAAVAWFFLVRAAIDFGAEGRSGDNTAWVFLGLAALGAIGCLLLALVLLSRALMALGIVTDPSTRVVGRHRS
jgi:hypothetical protein